MLHTKFQGHRSIDSGEEEFLSLAAMPIYGENLTKSSSPEPMDRRP